MSVATELPPVAHIPDREHRDRPSATVLPFRAPAASRRVIEDATRPADRNRPRQSGAPDGAAFAVFELPVPERDEVPRAAGSAGLRLTSRGAVAFAAALAVMAAALVYLAWLSAPAARAPAGNGPARPAAVTVHDGDTLWSIAARLAPQRDPRAVVAELERLNGLADGAVLPGQTLRTG
ncbi:MAG: LysM domain-containing protein [Actinomycetota bacterium]